MSLLEDDLMHVIPGYEGDSRRQQLVLQRYECELRKCAKEQGAWFDKKWQAAKLMFQEFDDGADKAPGGMCIPVMVQLARLIGGVTTQWLPIVFSIWVA